MQLHDTTQATVAMIPVERIKRGDNDRTVFKVPELEELADSIRELGLLQPITVRSINGHFEIVAGERRFLACQRAGLDHVPCMVRHLDDGAAASVMLTENVARADLDPIDEARAYQKRIEDQGWTVERIAKAIGVTKSRVTRRVALLALRPEIQQAVRAGGIPLTYASLLADAGLDANRQSIAVARLRDNANPQVLWFRGVLRDLFEEQAQEPMGLFMDSNGGGVGSRPGEPLEPMLAVPPSLSGSPEAILRGHAAFWHALAGEWAKTPKARKRNQCLATARGLEMAAEALEAVSDAR